MTLKKKAIKLRFLRLAWIHLGTLQKQYERGMGVLYFSWVTLRSGELCTVYPKSLSSVYRIEHENQLSNMSNDMLSGVLSPECKDAT